MKIDLSSPPVFIAGISDENSPAVILSTESLHLLIKSQRKFKHRFDRYGISSLDILCPTSPKDTEAQKIEILRQRKWMKMIEKGLLQYIYICNL